MKRYGTSVFGNSEISNITFGDKLNEIGSMAFDGCSRLTGSLEIPDTVTKIGTHIFWRTKLSEITLGKGITAVPQRMFYSAPELTKVIFKNSEITNIGEQSFFNCSSLTTLDNINWKTLNNIGKDAFSGCQNLEGTITLNGNCTFDRETTFFNCPLKVQRENLIN